MEVTRQDVREKGVQAEGAAATAPRLDAARPVGTARRPALERSERGRGRGGGDSQAGTGRIAQGPAGAGGLGLLPRGTWERWVLTRVLTGALWWPREDMLWVAEGVRSGRVQCGKMEPPQELQTIRAEGEGERGGRTELPLLGRGDPGVAGAGDRLEGALGRGGLGVPVEPHGEGGRGGVMREFSVRLGSALGQPPPRGSGSCRAGRDAGGGTVALTGNGSALFREGVSRSSCGRR